MMVSSTSPSLYKVGGVSRLESVSLIGIMVRVTRGVLRRGKGLMVGIFRKPRCGGVLSSLGKGFERIEAAGPTSSHGGDSRVCIINLRCVPGGEGEGGEGG